MKSPEYIEGKYVDILNLTNYQSFYEEFWKNQKRLLSKRETAPEEFMGHIEAPQWMYYTVLHRLASAHLYIETMVDIEESKISAKTIFHFIRAYEACLNEFYGALESIKELIKQLRMSHVAHNGKIYSKIKKCHSQYKAVYEKLYSKIPTLKLHIRHQGTHKYKPFLHYNQKTGRFMQLKPKKYVPGIVFSDYSKAIEEAKKTPSKYVEEVIVSCTKQLNHIVLSFNSILKIISADLLPIYFPYMEGLLNKIAK